MSKADELAAKAARIQAAAKRSEKTRTEAVPKVAAAPAPSAGRTIRLSVDVSPEQYAWLDQWGLSAGADQGVARVPKQRLIRALIALAADDPAVCEQAIQQLKK